MGRVGLRMLLDWLGERGTRRRKKSEGRVAAGGCGIEMRMKKILEDWWERQGVFFFFFLSASAIGLGAWEGHGGQVRLLRLNKLSTCYYQKMVFCIRSIQLIGSF